MADDIDDLQALLRDKPQVQEKIYVHTDNNTYFVGDTLWYKAYVVTADDLKPTNMSRLLYVELVSPDGYVVERQHVVVNSQKATCGQFVLEDSLYSGYYEIRAYTKWQLNFNVTHKEYTRDDKFKFYNPQAAADFFRDWEGLYSRVLPVFQKPRDAGNYVERYMAHRPKQRVLKNKEALYVTFYPEGGQLIKGVPCNVGFVVQDQNGQQLQVEGKLADGKVIKPQHMGMGSFTITPDNANRKVTFALNGKTYTFNLPKAVEQGMSLHYDVAKSTVTLTASQVVPAAYSIMCRGRLMKFERLDASQKTIAIDQSALTTGVNEVIVYDEKAQPLASRLFFVNHNDYGEPLTVTMTTSDGEVQRNTTIQPYAPVNLTIAMPTETQANGQSISVSVRDRQTDDPGYDTGNIMTDMLLSSELRGFIANPDYYFSGDDKQGGGVSQSTKDLDLLMAIQGWRRYKRVKKIRYMPEFGLTFEGTVNKVPSTANILELTDMEGVGQVTSTIADVMAADMERVNSAGATATGGTFGATAEDPEASEVYGGANFEEDISSPDVEWADMSDVDYQLKDGRLKKAVLVEAELVKGTESAGAVAKTDGRGHFLINLPPFYDKAFLFAKAYTHKDSLRKNMQVADPDKLNEREFPDFYIRREMFFPIFTQPYSWYQINSPELLFVDEEDENSAPDGSLLAGNHTLQTVIVKARRRGKRGIDMSKPALVRDAYDVYNDITDYGLSFGVVDFKRMPIAVATLLCGNMGDWTQFNVRALVNGTSFYRNYTPNVSEYDKPKTATDVFATLRLKRIKNIRLFTDYELRTDSGYVRESSAPAVTLDFETMEENSERFTYRDRRYVIDGITYAEEFYSPDYSNAVPAQPTDYRRTLYWNPNATFDEAGRFNATFYNNARETRMTVSAEGMDANGRMYVGR